MMMTSRAEALGQGIKSYFTGKPCKNGHVSERSVANRMCTACRADYERRYYDENKATYAERDRKRYAEKRDEVLARQRNYRVKNPERAREISARSRAKDREAQAVRVRNHYQKNRSAILERQRLYTKENPDKVAAKVALRRARKLHAAPPWFGELDQFVWQEAADLARQRELATGIDWASDHMIPLAAKNACGLHVWANCQVIPAYLNGWKHRKMVLTVADEWLKYL